MSLVHPRQRSSGIEIESKQSNFTINVQIVENFILSLFENSIKLPLFCEQPPSNNCLLFNRGLTIYNSIDQLERQPYRRLADSSRLILKRRRPVRDNNLAK